MSARAWNGALGITFAMLGSGLAVAGWRLPEGLAGIPGPGAFPLLVGIAMAVLGLALVAFSYEERTTFWQHGWGDPPLRQVGAILGLLAAYVALWDLVPFIWRTPALLLAIYRAVGEPWLRSTTIAVGATALLWGMFEALLRVRL